MKRALRYLAPNLVTSLGLILGLLSIVAAKEGRFVDAGWLIIWGVLLDRLDGGVARLLDASSEFGVQMDSFADFLNFGVAPGFLMFTFLESQTQFGFDSGFRWVLLAVACTAWVLANALRLARFNVATAEEGAVPVFFGVPTTLMAGILIIWYLVLLKYSPAALVDGDPDTLGFPKILGSWEIPLQVWSYVPVAMLVGALLMVSNVPVPKLARKSSTPLTIAMFALAAIGYACGFARSLPDLMAWLPSSWIAWSLIWGLLSRDARGLEPPPWR